MKVKSKKSKFHKFLILVMFLILVVSGCKNLTTNDIEEKAANQTSFPPTNESLLDDIACKIDNDCVITSTKKFECCSSCSIETVNKEAKLEREKWEKQNCKPDNYQTCESTECGITPEQFVSFCNGTCTLVYKEEAIKLKISSILKPDDILFCEKDEDCTETVLEEDSCCTSCPYSINKQGQLYLEELHNQNCKNVRGLLCPAYSCVGISEVKCENNKCIGITSKT